MSLENLYLKYGIILEERMNNLTQIQKGKNYPNIDIMKFVCSLLIIIIHTAPLKEISDLANFYLVDVIARIAVPLFFTISGFLFFDKLIFENEKIKNCKKNHAKLLQCVKKNTILYFIASAVYIGFQIPMWSQSGWGMGNIIKDCIAAFVLVGTHYHLWYLLALIYAIPVLYFLMSIWKVKKVIIITSIFWICECLIYSYSWIGVNDISIISTIKLHMPILFDTLFRAVPLIMIGVMVNQYQTKKITEIRNGFFIFFFLLVALEASILYFFTPNHSQFSYLFMTPLMSFAGISTLVNSEQCEIALKKQIWFRDISMYIYIVHPMIVDILLKRNFPKGVLLWIGVTLLSIGVSCGLQYVNKKLRFLSIIR